MYMLLYVHIYICLYIYVCVCVHGMCYMLTSWNSHLPSISRIDRRFDRIDREAERLLHLSGAAVSPVAG